jgi:uncharacterized HAD superfamily protein
MRIGIDIDDVVTNTSETIMQSMMNESNNETLKILQAHMKEIMKGNISDPEVLAFCSENYVKVYQMVKMKENAKEVIQRLLSKGDEIYFITARGERMGFFKGAEDATLNFLRENDVKYNDIIFGAMDKAAVCLENKIDLFIDDSVEHCEDVNKAGIKSLVFTSRVNKDTPTSIERVNDWLELEKRIEEIKDAK